MCNNVRFEIWPSEKMGMDYVETRRDVSRLANAETIMAWGKRRQRKQEADMRRYG
jgi:hypothetical protein